MRSNEIVSLRTALRYLARGDSKAKRLRLAAILLTMAVPIGALIFLGITVGTS
jgi:hypothetical protein